MDPPPPSADPQAGSGGRELEIARARELLASGHSAEALSLLQALVPRHPNDRELRLLFADALESAGRPAEALAVVEALLQADPQSRAAWQAKARIYRRAGDVEGLLEALRAVAQLDPSDRVARLEEYQLLDLRGDRDEALRVLTEVTAPGDSPLPEVPISTLWLTQAELALSLGRIDLADEAFRRAAEADPELTAQAAFGRARAARADGRPDIAIERLRPLVEGRSGGVALPGEVRQIYGELLCAAERIGEAQAVYDAWLAAEPTSALALEGAARTRIEAGRHPEARELLRNSLPHVALSEGLVLALAEAESGSGDLTAAERGVREGLERFPEGVSLYARLAEIDVARGDWPGAETAYRHALTIRPRDSDLLLGIAFVLEKRGDRAAALATYQEAALVAPSDLRVWSRQGTLLLAAGRPDDARASFEKALAIDPESDAARDGRRLAEREHRTVTIDGFGLAALREEAKLGRPITKNDLFVALHVPFDLLDPVLAAIARDVSVDVPALPAEELEQLERESNVLIGRALSAGMLASDGGEIGLAGVAAFADPDDRLLAVQRRFAYVRAVLGMEIRPENLHLTPEVEAVARRALSLPVTERGLFALVAALGIGLFRARIVKAVERASGVPRSHLPSVEIPEEPSPGTGRPPDSDRIFGARTLPLAPADPLLAPAEAARAPAVRAPRGWPKGVAPLTSSARTQTGAHVPVRCIGCGGVATVQHSCGGALCALCAHQFGNCPKCGEPIGARPVISGRMPSRSPPSRRLFSRARAPPPKATRLTADPPRGAAPRGGSGPSPRAGAREASPTATPCASPREGSPRAPSPAAMASKAPPRTAPAVPSKERAAEPQTTGSKVAAPPASPSPRARREKPDDEPRL